MTVFEQWRLIFAALAGALYFNGLCYSETVAAPKYNFLKEATAAFPVAYFDYIIIGGGTAGCPVAATLSQNFTVLLIERGGSPYGNHNITNLANFPDILADDTPASPSQTFTSEDGVVNTRARVLGGGSCLNAGFYTRASTTYVRDARWDGKLVNQSYRWVEKLVVFEPQMLQWQSAFRDGLLEVGVLPYNGYTFDHIYGTKIGGTIFDKDGHRHTAADLLEYANPNGLTVLLHATVQKILFRTKGRTRPAAHGVIFMDADGTKHRAYLKKGTMNEIIVSAGALGSPQLLILSGVGPAEHLKSFGIHVVLDQPMVGQGMADPSMNIIVVPSPSPVEVSLIQVVGITKNGTYIEATSGISFAQRIVSMLSPLATRLSTVPPNQRTQEAIDIAMEAMKSLQEPSYRGGVILQKVTGPVSKGYLKIRNRNPDDNPSVLFNYYKEPEDLQRCVNGLKIIESVIQSKAFSKFRYLNISMDVLLQMTEKFVVNVQRKHFNASKSLEQYCKDTVLTIWHYHGGCQVGRVVDHDYRVFGLDSLRVIDGSTFVASPGTNPQATVMMLGRYMGVKIRNERLGTHGLD